MQPVYDDLINSGEIEPIVVVFPVLKFKTVHGKTIPHDLHFFTDSERNGNYESAITKDILEWLPVWFNVTSRREERAIGGFSMGGDGSVRIAIRNSDKFVACVSHDGNPDMRAQLLYRPYLLAEMDGPPYHYAIENGYWTADWFGFAAAFAPNMTNPTMPEWYFDFPLDSLGNVIDSIFYDRIMAHHDPATMMKNPEIYKNDVAIFFDSTDDGRSENGLFHNELVSMGVPHTYEMVNGHHGIYDQTIRSSLKFINNAMNEALAQKDIERDVWVRAPFDRIAQLNSLSNEKYTPKAVIKNIGSIDLSAITVNCEILQANMQVYSENIILNSLPSRNSIDVAFPAWKPGKKDVYDVQIYTNLAADQNQMNDTLKTQILVSTLVDDFEHGMTKWTGNQEWETVNKDSLEQDYCVGHSPYFEYDNNCDDWLITKGSFNFSSLKSATLDFSTRYLFADEGDLGLVHVSLDSGITWTQIGDTLKGNMDTWQKFSFSLNDFTGLNFPKVWLGFQMKTNESGRSTGWFLDNISLSVEEFPASIVSKESTVKEFSLAQNYPNPFNPSTTIRFTIPRATHVTLKVYNILGKEIETLADEKLQTGAYNIEWDAGAYSSGLYFCRIQADEFAATRKLVLQK